MQATDGSSVCAQNPIGCTEKADAGRRTGYWDGWQRVAGLRGEVRFDRFQKRGGHRDGRLGATQRQVQAAGMSVAVYHLGGVDQIRPVAADDRRLGELHFELF